jgi:hypothetical protein
MTAYRYSMSGTAAMGQTFAVQGRIGLKPGDFSEAFTQAMRDAFSRITRGRAVFGKPGIGCDGPYTIREFTIQVVD